MLDAGIEILAIWGDCESGEAAHKIWQMGGNETMSTHTAQNCFSILKVVACSRSGRPSVVECGDLKCL